MSERRVDRRRASYKRFAALVAALTADIGVDDPSVAQRSLVEHCATVMLRAERLRDKILAGESCDDDQLVRLSNAARRLLSAVIVERGKKKTTPSLEAYLTQTASQ